MSFQFKFEEFDDPTDTVEIAAPQTEDENAVQSYSLDSLLPRTKISWSRIGADAIPRRDLFDVRYQLMAKDTPLSETEQILIENSEDVRAGVYEGGMKVWECTFDLIEVVKSRSTGEQLSKTQSSVIELGCGAALPSTYLVRILAQSRERGAPAVKVALADYNEAVLRLLTAPNVLLAYLDGLGRLGDAPSGEVQVTEDLITEVVESLNKQSIDLQFISGPWSQKFVETVGDSAFDIALASETVYSLDTIPQFTTTIQGVLKQSGQGLVAAKEMYFGVGGGIPSFTNFLESQNKGFIPVTQIVDGVGRAVVEIGK